MPFDDAISSDGHRHDRKAAPLFDLFEQPFYVLGVDPATTNLEVDNAFAAASLGALGSGDATARAREAILSPIQRLSCELSYPLDSQPQEIAELYEVLRSEASTRESLLFAEKLGPLSSANFCAHIAASRPADSALLYGIVVSHCAVDSSEIYDTLKAFRIAAGWPAPSLLSVNQGLRELLNLHAEAAFGSYRNIEDAGEPVLACTQAILAGDDRYQIEVLARFLAAYRKAIETKQSRAATLIKNACSALQQRPEEARFGEVLSNALQFWGLLSRPLILLDACQNRDDEILLSPVECVSLLVDDLTRDHHYPLAHQIAELGRDVLDFAGDRFDKQLRRIKHLASGGAIKPLRDLTGQLAADPSALIRALEQSGFGPQSKEPAGRLWETFEDAARPSDEANSGEPWSLLRDLAMELSRGQHHAAASALIRGVIQQGQGVAAARQTLLMLPYDLSSIEGQLSRQLVPTEMQRPSAAAKVPAVLEPPLAADFPPSALAAVNKPERKRRRVLICLAAIAVGGAGLYVGLEPDLRAPWNLLARPAADLATSPYPEIVPPVGTGQRYSLPNIRYCHFQQERLSVIKQLIQGAEDTRAYNLLVVDYNARCSDFLYQPQDLETVLAEVAAAKTRLAADAKRIIALWPGHGTASSMP